MYWFKTIYNLFHTFFDIFSFRKKPEYISFSDIENQDEYEFIMLNDKIK